MSPTFSIVEAKRWHCGQMVRILRHQHMAAVSDFGADAHAELRKCFAESPFRRAWLINGQLAALGGVAGASLESRGVVWVAFSELAARHPIAMVKECRRQLDAIMGAKRELSTLILSEDHASLRLAVFLNFHVTSLDLGAVSSRHGRRFLLKVIDENYDKLRVKIETGYAIPVVYAGLGVH